VADPLAATVLLDPGSDRDPSRGTETRVLAEVQHRLGRPPVVRAARGLSQFGEHAAGWLALGLLGAAVDRSRRRDWLCAAAGVATAHGASILVKGVIRRPRPDDPSVEVLVEVPSWRSFPSAHASSTTAAAVLYGGLLGSGWSRWLTSVLVPPMLVSRLVLGVHFPSDVLAGSALGAAVGGVVRRATARRARS
jgi:membrane-associated phospholipid phosphatase